MVQNVLKEKALKYKGTKGYIKCYGKLGFFFYHFRNICTHLGEWKKNSQSLCHMKLNFFNCKKLAAW